MLEPSAIKRFYDRFGSRQDRQGFYEDAALDEVFDHADVSTARAIVEFGCGTGRLAERVLAATTTASYVGFDVSTMMVALARERLATFRGRARVDQLATGAVHLPLPDGSADRFVSTYVLDLLSPHDIGTVLEEAHRVIVPGGRLCLVSLTTGSSIRSRLVAGLWRFAFSVRPQLVGGCRPIRLGPYCDQMAWEVLHHRTVVRWAIPSEVLIARRRAG